MLGYLNVQVKKCKKLLSGSVHLWGQGLWLQLWGWDSLRVSLYQIQSRSTSQCGKDSEAHSSREWLTKGPQYQLITGKHWSAKWASHWRCWFTLGGQGRFSGGVFWTEIQGIILTRTRGWWMRWGIVHAKMLWLGRAWWLWETEKRLVWLQWRADSLCSHWYQLPWASRAGTTGVLPLCKGLWWWWERRLRMRH